jgi:hypothetical protein
MAELHSESGAPTRPTGITRIEDFFRAAAELDIDKQDVKRYEDFVNRKLTDLLIRGVAAAKSNDRDIIDPWDLPITKGLQECIQEFGRIDQRVRLRPTLDRIVAWPPLELALRDTTEEQLPEIAGGLSVALARCFKQLDPDMKNPKAEHWHRIEQIFALLM